MLFLSMIVHVMNENSEVRLFSLRMFHNLASQTHKQVEKNDKTVFKNLKSTKNI